MVVTSPFLSDCGESPFLSESIGEDSQITGERGMISATMDKR